MRVQGQSSIVLTERERLQRVAEILCKAILLGEADEAMQIPNTDLVPEAMPTSTAPVDRQAEDERIIRYLDLVGEASPAEIRDMLGLTRSTAWRALHRLARTQRIAGSGQTRQLVYRIAGEPPAHKIGLN